MNGATLARLPFQFRLAGWFFQFRQACCYSNASCWCGRWSDCLHHRWLRQPAAHGSNTLYRSRLNKLPKVSRFEFRTTTFIMYRLGPTSQLTNVWTWSINNCASISYSAHSNIVQVWKHYLCTRNDNTNRNSTRELESVRSVVHECDLTERHNNFVKPCRIAGPTYGIILFNLNIWL